MRRGPRAGWLSSRITRLAIGKVWTLCSAESTAPSREGKRWVCLFVCSMNTQAEGAFFFLHAIKTGKKVPQGRSFFGCFFLLSFFLSLFYQHRWKGWFFLVFCEDVGRKLIVLSLLREDKGRRLVIFFSVKMREEGWLLFLLSMETKEEGWLFSLSSLKTWEEGWLFFLSSLKTWEG